MSPAWGNSAEDDADNSIVFRDLLLLTLSAIIVCLCLVMPHIASKTAKAAQDGSAMQGNMMVEAFWPNDVDSDVDLWVQAPGDVPVGYSNKGGAIFNLLRDDLGSQADVSGVNMEVAYARGLPAGEYTINVHLYRSNHADMPLRGRIVVSTRPNGQPTQKQILLSEFALQRDGQELTVMRFRIDGDGDLVPGSVGNLPKPLREATSQ